MRHLSQPHERGVIPENKAGVKGACEVGLFRVSKVRDKICLAPVTKRHNVIKEVAGKGSFGYGYYLTGLHIL